MRKLFLVAVTTCAIGSLAVPAASAVEQAQPTLSVYDRCPPELPFDNLMLEVIVSGVGPGEEVTGSSGPHGNDPPWVISSRRNRDVEGYAVHRSRWAIHRVDHLSVLCYAVRDP